MGKNRKKDKYTRKEEENGKKTIWIIGLVAVLLMFGIIAIGAYLA